MQLVGKYGWAAVHWQVRLCAAWLAVRGSFWASTVSSGALASTVVAAGGFSYKIYGLCTLLKKLFLLELSAHQVRCMSPSSSG